MTFKAIKYSFLNKKGFTLIEVLVSLPMIVMITGIVLSITFILFNMQKTTEEHLQIHMNNTNIIQAIAVDISDNGELEVINDKEFILNNNSYSFLNQKVVRINEKNIEHELAEGNYNFEVLNNLLSIKSNENKLNITFDINVINIKKEGE